LQDRVTDELMPAAIDGSLPLDEILSDYFVRGLHVRLFGPVWNWAGRWRRTEVNIGVAIPLVAGSSPARPTKPLLLPLMLANFVFG